MKLKFLLIYVLITFYEFSMINTREAKSNLEEDIISKNNLTIKEDLKNKKIHIVQEGDTLSGIANKYSTDIELIIKANNLSDENYIYIDQKLTIPINILKDLDITELDSTNFHEVKKGETLTYISLLYGIKLDKLLEINKLDNADSINVGKRIFLNEKTENKKVVIEKITDQNKFKRYGPLKINTQIVVENDTELINATNDNGDNLIISLDCDKKEINVRAREGKWKGWLPAKEEFENNLLNDFCKG